MTKYNGEKILFLCIDATSEVSVNSPVGNLRIGVIGATIVMSRWWASYSFRLASLVCGTFAAKTENGTIKLRMKVKIEITDHFFFSKKYSCFFS